MCAPSSGKRWAEASARTLARRLRREQRQELGLSRASALEVRARAFRVALVAHWRLSDALGCFLPAMGEEIVAARLLGYRRDKLDEAQEALAAGNWARHAPPPGAARSKPPQPQGLLATALEGLLAGTGTPLRAEAEAFVPGRRQEASEQQPSLEEIGLEASATGGAWGADDAPQVGQDTDGSAIGGNEDPDRGGDGAPSKEDQFPDDPREWKDTDGDGTGGNEEPNRVGDGLPNKDVHCTDDHHFPDDPKEWRDTDGGGTGGEWKDSCGDGIGGNEAPDRDGDDVPNKNSLFPDDPKELKETDGGGAGEPNKDVHLPDDHHFPDDPKEWKDTDGGGIGGEWKDSCGEGIGGNEAPDRGGDDVPNKDGFFPEAPKEWKDTDWGGIGGNEDPDRGYDRVPTKEDHFHDVPKEWKDTDGGGIGGDEQQATTVPKHVDMPQVETAEVPQIEGVARVVEVPVAAQASMKDYQARTLELLQRRSAQLLSQRAREQQQQLQEWKDARRRAVAVVATSSAHKTLGEMD